MRLFELPNNIKLSDNIKRHVEMTEDEYLTLISRFKNYGEEFEKIFYSSIRLIEVVSSNKLEGEIELSIYFMLELDKCGTALEKYINRLRENNGILKKEYIKELHYNLIRGYDDNKLPGEYRDRIVYIGDPRKGIECAEHIPPEPTEVDKYMAYFIDYYNAKDSGDMIDHPFIKSAILHSALAYIHPFVDGNGRVSRTLHSTKLWTMSSERYNLGLDNPALYLSKNINLYKLEYFKRLKDLSNFENNDFWNKWFEFILYRIDEQLYYLGNHMNHLAKSYENSKRLRKI